MSEAALDRWRGRTIGIVPQRLHLLPSLRLQTTCCLRSMPRACRRAAIGCARCSSGSGSPGARTPTRTSFRIGQAQRAAVARAVINRPRVVLADEPTSNLDDANCAQALDLLEGEAHACGATLVIATHDRRARDRFESGN